MSKPIGNPIIEGKNVVKDFSVNSNSLKKSKMRAINDVSDRKSTRLNSSHRL